MADETENNEYQWTFQVKDVVNFEETTITIYSDTYNEAIKKIKSLKLPQLRSFESIEESIKLTNVYEVNPFYDGAADVGEYEPEDKD